MIKAVIFDMDGVLIDSEPLHYEADSEVFRKLKIQVSEEDRAGFLGKGPEGVLAFLKEKFNVQRSLEELISLDNMLRVAYFKNHSLPSMPGIPDLLVRVQNLGIPMAVASSSVRPLVEYLLEKQGLTGYFKCVVCGDDVPKTKPDPAIFNLAAAKLFTNPGNCLVVEDSPNGLLAAKAAGMKCAVYNRQNRADLNSLPADYFFSSFAGVQAETLISI
jgi:HAD superfamily hydrolase (TIGR01509 family)